MGVAIHNDFLRLRKSYLKRVDFRVFRELLGMLRLTKSYLDLEGCVKFLLGCPIMLGR